MERLDHGKVFLIMTGIKNLQTLMKNHNFVHLLGMITNFERKMKVNNKSGKQFSETKKKKH